MENISLAGFSGLAAVYFLAFFVKGAVGIGALSPVILFGTLLVGPHHAVVLALTTNALSQIQFVPQGIRDGDWKIARQIVLANFLGAAGGVWIFGRLGTSWLTLLLGLALGLVVLVDRLELVPRLLGRVDVGSARVLIPLSLGAGVVSGVTGAGGIFFIAIYLRHVCPSTRSFRGTVLLLSALLVGWRTILLIGSGFITLPVLAEAALLFPIVLLGGVAGTRFYELLPTRRFYEAFQGILVLAAVSLVGKGLGELL